jgi:transcriptional regulator with XRE-family HTH domain
MEQKNKTMYDKAVIQIIKDLRTEKEYTQDEIADLMGVTRGYVGQIESPNFKGSYSLNQLNRLAYNLKCKVADLLPPDPIHEPEWDL